MPAQFAKQQSAMALPPSAQIDTSSLFLNPGAPDLTVKLHPVVVLSILDHFTRRQEGRERVIGTLLGTVKNGVVQISNSFPVPHTENEKVALDLDYQRNMMELHHKVAPKEVIVGWYATGQDINESSVLLHDFYWREMSHSPIHLTVDTSLTCDTLGARAFTGSPIMLGDKTLGSFFQPVSLEMQTFEAEKIGMDLLQRAKRSNGLAPLPTDLQNLESTLEKLVAIMDQVQAHVKKVLSGAIPSDAAVGRAIHQALYSLPHMDPDQLDKLTNNSLQDLLMVTYLANLTRTQLVLAEKIQQVV